MRLNDRFRLNAVLRKRNVIGEDCRSIGKAMLIAALIGAIITGDQITFRESVIVFVAGLVFWLGGVVLVESPVKKE